MPLQDIIHKVTEGSGARVVKVLLVFCVMAGLALWYDLGSFKNLSTIEGMDAAQLARNLSRGEGFTTRFIRPFSLYLTARRQQATTPATATALGETTAGVTVGSGVLGERYPDLANAPAYPVLLAAAFKAVPVVHPDTTFARDFSVYSPDRYIAVFNQLLFFLAVWMVFRLGRRLLDEPAAWVSAGVFAGSELFWRFSVSGQSTMLLIVLFLALVEVLSRIDRRMRDEPMRKEGWLTVLALLAGVLTGLAGLTRYSLGLLIIPVLGFLAGLPAAGRVRLMVTCALTFLAVMSPWVMRNWSLAGAPFGTAGYALYDQTALFRGFDLERTLHPDFSLVAGPELGHKLVTGVRDILEKELPRLGGSWVSAFFLVSLLVPFRNPGLGRLRYFVVGCLGLFIFVQALGRTGLTADSPEVNSENLLVVFAPMVFLFGVSLFFVLVEQFGVRLPWFRVLMVSVFLGLVTAPLWFTLFQPVRDGVSLPYYPPSIQERTRAVEPAELIMSDFPWAVAWYGERASVWLSLKYREEATVQRRNDFEAFEGLGKPLRALYLSARMLKTMETRALYAWVGRESEENWSEYVSDWDSFVLLGILLKQEIPKGFRLKEAPFGLLPELFLVDSERNEGKPIKGK